MNGSGMHGIEGLDNDIEIQKKENWQEKYVPFDVGQLSSSEMHLLSSGVDESGNFVNHEVVFPTSPKNHTSTTDILKTSFFILMWYTFSTFLTLYNKTLLGEHLGRFPAPLLMNTVHFAMQAVLSSAITWFWSYRFQSTVSMSSSDYFMKVVSTAIGTAMDVNLSNASLVSISVTFATMCKSASPIFLLVFAFVFSLESPSIRLLGIMVIISMGVLLTVAKETEFEILGFILVMLATLTSGFRWCMTQVLLQKEAYGLKNPFTLMSYVAPVMAITTILLSFIIEPWSEFKKSVYFKSSMDIARTTLLMFLGGTLAFFMVLTEYILVSITSAVTVTIAGVIKEAVTIVVCYFLHVTLMVAIFYFHDEFTLLKGIGLFTIFIGVSLFNWYKYQKLQKDQESEVNPTGSPSAGKYVIIEEMDNPDHNV